LAGIEGGDWEEQREIDAHARIEKGIPERGRSGERQMDITTFT